MKFLLDTPLGGLAKWLRFCGFDAELLRLTADVRPLPPPADDVYLLTASEAFKKLNRADILVLAAPDPGGQLEEVIRRCQISPRQFRPLTRCSHCNEQLVPLDRDQALGRVPEHVFNTQRQFFACPRCQRVYWPGSHLADLTGKIRKILEQAGSPA
jgi:uncharacterized protein